MEINFAVSVRAFTSSWNKTNLNTSELKPKALIFIHVLQLSGGMRREIIPSGYVEGHVLMRISREHGAVNVKDQSTEGY